MVLSFLKLCFLQNEIFEKCLTEESLAYGKFTSKFSRNFRNLNLSQNYLLFYFERLLRTGFICIHNSVGSSIRHKPCRPWIDGDGHFFSREVSDSQLFWQEDRRKYSSQSFFLKYLSVIIDQVWVRYRKTYRSGAEWIMLPVATIMKKLKSFIWLFYGNQSYKESNFIAMQSH